MSAEKTADEIIGLENSCIGKTFNRYPVVWEKGEGCWLWDKNGKKYLDFFSGHAVMNLGYGHPGQMRAMRAQMEKLPHTGNLFYLESPVRLAERLSSLSFGGKVFFANSGAEITELAIKLARKAALRRGGDGRRFEILTVQGSFHGRTYGALSATGQEKYHQNLGPMLPGFKHIPLNDIQAAVQAASDATCAILLEPVQGEGGVWPASREYLQALRALCDQKGMLLILDEIQCGLGRTGRLHAYEHFGVVPDALLLAKPLGGGLPISALIAKAEVAGALQVGDHGTTFGGNPVAAAGGLVLLEELSRPGFLEHVREMGKIFEDGLNRLASGHSRRVKAVRGLGLMWGLELTEPGVPFVQRALDHGLVINCTAGNVLRLLPPLIIEKDHVGQALQILDEILG